MSQRFLFQLLQVFLKRKRFDRTRAIAQKVEAFTNPYLRLLREILRVDDVSGQACGEA